MAVTYAEARRSWKPGVHRNATKSTGYRSRCNYCRRSPLIANTKNTSPKSWGRFFIAECMESMKGGTMHTLPADLRTALQSAKSARHTWDDITPLARNEYICWITSGAKAETRNIRIKKALSKLSGGMRRPCCWAGCPHR